MRTFRLTVAYDGTDFHGWQVQPDRRTVQGTLEEALAVALGGEVVRLAGAGRTDAGVHARGQVASFRAATRLPARAIAPRLARHLPPDVRIVDAAEAHADFHARHSAVARRYAYRLLWRDDVLAGRHAWHPPRPIAPDALARATAPLVGAHDFASFQSAGGTPTVTRCTMHRASWSPWEGGVRFDVVADHFLYHMVRTLVGTALEAARTSDPAAAMRAVLEARDRARAGIVAPACGLTLEQVFYAEAAA